MLGWRVAERTKREINDRKWTCWGGALLKGQKINMVKRAYTIQGGMLLKGQKMDMVKTMYTIQVGTLLKKQQQKMKMVKTVCTREEHCSKDRK